MSRRRTTTAALVSGASVILFAAAQLPAGDEPTGDEARPPVYREIARDPPHPDNPRDDPFARSAGARAQAGPFVSVQVNVAAGGQNITGDAANEPSIAVSPTNPDNIVIGWRQFDSIQSDFRQAGWAFSLDGGQSWAFPGVLDPGVFRSDPVLDTDSAGDFYYQSLTADAALTDFSVDVYRSSNGGAGWSFPTPSFGGDKNWMSIDRSGGQGDGNVYGIWQRFFGCCGEATFTRSTNGGDSFEAPLEVPLRPTFGTLAVGPDGEVYAAGIEGTVTQDFNQFVLSKTDDAQGFLATPTFTGVRVDLGGSMVIGGAPNPSGLIGQANVAVDSSSGPTRGNVYLLASVKPPGTTNPADVHLIRSTDGGVTWSSPIRVNNDPLDQGVWHWFGALAVAPNGRIDAIWNDTRNTGQATVSELFYAYSHDAGDTWFGNRAVSPPFDTSIGFPSNAKIGDYYTVVSDRDGAKVAYSATFNGEQDVYYVRLFPDCNGNGIKDESDIEGGVSQDCNANSIPDDCELAAGSRPDCNGNSRPDECDIADSSPDCNGNGQPDECEPDCNANGIADECDIAAGMSTDCTVGFENGVPDECEPDCDLDGQVDTCEIALGAADDCNGDGIADECEPDCDANGVPDPCQTELAFTRHLVTASAPLVQSAFVADVDGDGDPDILSATLGDSTIAWYENTDGKGTFAPARLISTTAGAAQSVFAADLDGDDDLDVLSAALADDTIAWYENLDGDGTFGLARIISMAADGARAVIAVDIDGDMDADVVSASLNDDTVAWYENTDGFGSFGPPRLVTALADGPWSIHAADLDGDGDADLLTASTIDDEVAWYENIDGAGNFTRSLIDAGADGARSVFAADVDDDDDLDVLAGSTADDTVAWYENLDGQGSFGAAHVISAGADGVESVIAADLDGDRDLDVVSASAIDDRVAWYRNRDGFGTFDMPREVYDLADEPLAVLAADVDGDGDLDLISASAADNSLNWFENTGNDCNSDGVPDICEPDCNVNGIPDACDLIVATSFDCNGNGVPDECDAACGTCDLDGDGCVDEVDASAADPFICADADLDGCEDCSSGTFDPDADGTDTDSDGRCDIGDCDATNNAAWAAPSAIATLRVARQGETALLTWAVPSALGGVEVRFDTLFSSSPADFNDAATVCIDSDGSDTGSVDVPAPGSGEVRYYLVRVENDCPGDGAMGADSNGTPRLGVTCP